MSRCKVGSLSDDPCAGTATHYMGVSELPVCAECGLAAARNGYVVLDGDGDEVQPDGGELAKVALIEVAT